MKLCRTCQIEKPLADFHTKVGGRFGVAGSCRSCGNAKNKKYQDENRDIINANRAKCRSENRVAHNERVRLKYAQCGDRIRESNRRYYESNRSARAKQNKEWREKNRDRLQKYCTENAVKIREKNTRWRNANRTKWRALMAEYARRRQLAKARAMPEWADIAAIQKIYALSQDVSEATGVKHHVDHIVPLVHPLVCGLHVHWNLQILTATDNLSKSNKFEV